MAKIPLRAYIKEIENLIDRGEIEPAIAHARNILRTYPKNIDTYRLLGKAYLESQRYSEAADILQRVLSVVPDDFVSQIGMSIIREDEGNMDAAIWHMERAYEVQPFNPAVQDELRRLYGRRDGVEPPKIRLTRGALVRMYTRGELYPQAIAETRAAIAEDPQRYDLRVLLARLYYQTGQKNDAAEVCSELISKLPYCYEANRLLTEILPTTSRAEETQKFQQRINALNPYEAFVSPSAPTSAQVPDQAVMVEEYTWDAAAEESQSPGWVRTVGATWEEPEAEEALPDWLSTLKPESAASEQEQPAGEAEVSAPVSSDLGDESSEPGAAIYSGEAQSEDLVPDWMKEAGWAPADRPADEIMAEQVEAEEAAEIQPGEIPDWLQSMAPAEAQSEQAAEEERTDWLESLITPVETAETTEEEAPLQPTTEELTAEELAAFTAEMREPSSEETEAPVPDWLAGLAADEQLQPGEETPEWLEKSTDEVEQAPSGEPETSIFESEEILDQPPIAETGESVAVPSTEEVPEWLKSLEGEAEGPVSEISEWSSTEEQETAEQAAGEPTVMESAAAAEVPDWLQSLKEEVVQSSDERDVPSVEERLPEGLLEEAYAEEAAPATQPEAVEEEAPAAVIESVETIETGEYETPAVVESTLESAPDFSDMDATMAWLEALAARQGADEATLITPPEQRSEELPEWLQNETVQAETAQVDLTENAIPSSVEESQVEEIEEAEAGIAEPSVEIEAAALAEVQEEKPSESEPLTPEWLAVEEETEEPATTPSEVLYQETEKKEAEIEPVESGEMLQQPVDLTTEEVPSLEKEAEPSEAAESLTPEFNLDDAMAWLESLAAKQGADEETLITPPEQRTEVPPEWVQEMEADTSQPEGEKAEEQVTDQDEEMATESTEEVSGKEELPQWLMEMASETIEAEQVVFEGAANADEVEEFGEPGGLQEEGAPEWLKDIKSESYTETPEEEAEWSLESGEVEETGQEMPSWLAEGIEESSGEPTKAKESEEMPGWLLGLEEEEEAISSTSEGSESSEYHTAWEPEISEEIQVEQVPTKEAEPVASMVELRKSLDAGDLDAAIEGYSGMIQNSENLGEIIRDLREALYRFPVDITLWQTLGDAYARNDQLQEALDAYTKAEELLR